MMHRKESDDAISGNWKNLTLSQTWYQDKTCQEYTLVPPYCKTECVQNGWGLINFKLHNVHFQKIPKEIRLPF